MPRQNRVTPFGSIVADPGRGLFMGNRGILHDADGRLVGRPWRHPHWIICVLSFKGRQRRLMTPGTYTELFFLDEATALAAGHRPCAECRRAAYRQFVGAWASACGIALPGAVALDRALHADRLTARREQRTFEFEAARLPDGAMYAHGDVAWLVRARRGWRWTPAGYDRQAPLPIGPVPVLTPRPTLAALNAGYRPILHPSADA